jgi:hypothetical protein
MVCSQAGHPLIGFGVKLCSPSISSSVVHMTWDCHHLSGYMWLGKGSKAKKGEKELWRARSARGQGKPRCEKDGVQSSGPSSDRFWSETLLTLHHIECGSHEMTFANPSPMGGCSISTRCMNRSKRQAKSEKRSHVTTSTLLQNLKNHFVIVVSRCDGMWWGVIR